MKDLYCISFLKVVESGFQPRTKTMDSQGNSYVMVEFPGSDNVFGSVRLKKFKNKENFMNHMTKKLEDAWDAVDAEKKFKKECTSILEDIDEGKAPEAGDEFIAFDERDEYLESLCKQSPLNVITDETVTERLKNIKDRDLKGWEPYIILRELYGVDLIRTPDLAAEENLDKMKSERPDPVDNCGIVRRIKGN